MKTLQELYDEVISSDELKKEFAAASANETDAKAFLEKYGCGSSLDDLKSFLKEKFEPANGAMKELEDADLDEVAGGTDKIATHIGLTVIYDVTGCMTTIDYSLVHADDSLNCKLSIES